MQLWAVMWTNKQKKLSKNLVCFYLGAECKLIYWSKSKNEKGKKEQMNKKN